MSCLEKEPVEVRAGFSTTWKRRLSEYPSAEYTLKYALRKIDGSGTAKTITATEAGSTTFKATLSPSDTDGLEGVYRLVGYVEDISTGGTSEKVVVYDSTLTVEPDPLSAEPGDLRTHARRMVDLLRAALEKLASGTISSASVNGKQYTSRSLEELRAELSRYEQKVAEEDSRYGPDCGNPNNVLIRFNRL